MFHPTEMHVVDPVDHGIAYEDIFFRSSDGIRLHAWRLLSPSPSNGLIVFAHGNAQNISHHINSVYWLPAAGYDVLLFDYRGYGKSESTPSLAGLHQDTITALRVAGCMEPPSRMVAFGQSIGGSMMMVAVSELSWNDDLGGLIVESAPLSYRKLAQERLSDSWLTWSFQIPLSWLIPDSHRAIDAARNLPAFPKLLIGNLGDETVEAHHSRILYENTTAPKQLWTFDTPGHITPLLYGQPRKRLLEWIDTVLPADQTNPGITDCNIEFESVKISQ